MKILFVQREYNPYKGGVQRVTSLLSKYFENSNIKCYYLFKNEQDTQLADLPSDCYRIITPHNGNDIIQFIVENKIDIIINQHLYESFVIQLYKELKKMNPHIVILNTFHNTPDDFLHYINPIAYKFRDKIKKLIGIKTRQQIVSEMYEVCDKMILLSPSYVDVFRKWYNVEDGKKLSVIPNPLTFKGNFIGEDFAKKEKKVLVAARLASQKNLFSLLRIWKKIENKTNEWSLIIAGTGEEEDKLKKYSKRLKLKYIIFKGQVDDIKPLYEKCSILALTSTFEGFPMSLLEAMQMGNAAIAFNTFKAIKDINALKQCIISIPPFDEEAYSVALYKLLSDDAMRLSLEKNALQVASEFSIEKIGKQWEKLFQELNKV